MSPAPARSSRRRDRDGRVRTGEVDRRTFTLQGMAAAVLAGVALAGAGLAAGLGRLGGKSQPSTTPSRNPSSSGAPSPTRRWAATPDRGRASTTTPVAKPAGTRVASASAVPVGGSATFQDPRTGDPSILVQPEAGTFVAVDAICPHEGCIVGFSPAQQRFICPCHGSEFNGKNGKLIHGPAPRGLGRIPVKEGPDGGLYVT